jgi:DNA-binding response OmpR family regulator
MAEKRDMEKKRILVVEDEHDMRTLLGVCLEASGYDVYGACDGEEGMRETAQVFPDLIILDLMLPKMGGYEVCARLKADPHLSAIPILIFTARAGDIDRFIGLQCGADEYLPKPFNEEVLLEKIHNLLEGHSSAQIN